ncbi:MAG: hypothetical protein IKU29_01605 [Parabacteroides sp.]|nr:hypothetical protein [Parabacteroides sp.]
MEELDLRTKKMKKVLEELKREIKEINPSADFDGEVIDFILGENHFGKTKIQVWVDQMHTEIDLHKDMNTTSIPQLVDLNDLRWYAICKYLAKQNSALRAIIDKLIKEEDTDADN